jgi:perosamine synthetase
LEKLDAMLAARAKVASLYEDGLGTIDGVTTPIASRGAERRSWFVYPVRLSEGIDRDGVIASLAADGIASKAYLPCIHLFPHLRELGYREGQFPVAEAASAHSLALPFFPAMVESQVARVCEALAGILR